MEPKNRLVIVAAVTILILGAMFTSFGRSLFGLNTPSVVLPVDSTESDDEAGGQTQEQAVPVHRVEVTPETVQSVIATLARSDSFYRELTVEAFWGESDSSVTQIESWTDNGWSHSRQTLPSGAVRHDLVGNGTLYYWYEGNHRYLSVPADDASADLAQRIPTYETVLSLDAEDITDTGYGMREEFPCIYVETRQEELKLLTRYWVSVDSGLLISAEQLQNEQLVYRMTSYGAVQSPCPPSASFALPDGLILHSIS